VFKRSKDQALLFVESMIKELGELFFLMKDNTHWNVIFKCPIVFFEVRHILYGDLLP